MSYRYVFALCLGSAMSVVYLCKQSLWLARSSRRFRQTFLRRSSTWGSVESEASASDGEVVDNRGLKVAVVGCPNSGKSSITNLLVRAKVCAVSKRIDTTKTNTTTVLTENMGQIPSMPTCQLAVVDSPGIITVRHAQKVIGTHSDADILVDPEKAMKHADHLLVIHDATNGGQYIQHRIIHLLHRYAHIPATLVLNKIDLIEERRDLLQLAEVLTEGFVDGVKIAKEAVQFGRMDSNSFQSERSRRENKQDELDEGMPIHPIGPNDMDAEWHKTYSRLLQRPTHKCSWSDTKKLFQSLTGWPHFKSVFFVSCKKGTGIDDLREYLKGLSNPIEWKFGEELKSTKRAEEIALEHIRSEFLDALPAHCVYSMFFDIIEYEQVQDDDGHSIMRLLVDVKCIKKQWGQLAFRALERIEHKLTRRFSTLFGVEVQLLLQVKWNNKLITSDTDSPPKVTTSARSNAGEKEMKKFRESLGH